MLEDMAKDLFAFVILVLDDEKGVSEASYDHLRRMADHHEMSSLHDLLDRCKATDGRYYLPEQSA